MVRLVFALATALVACSSLSDARVVGGAVRKLDDGSYQNGYSDSASSYQQQINNYKYNYNQGDGANYYQNDDGAAAAANDDAQQQEAQGDDQAAANYEENFDYSENNGGDEFYEASDATEATESEEETTTDSGRFKIDGSKWIKTQNALEIYKMVAILFGSLSVVLVAYICYLRRRYLPSSEKLIHVEQSLTPGEPAASQGTYQLDDMASTPVT